MKSPEIVENDLGFWEIVPKPDPADLERFYRDKYFGATDQRTNYAYGYTPEELKHKYIDAAEAQAIVGGEPRKMLEVGCGEGFFLDYFFRLGWDVKGIDFTSDGINGFFPQLVDRVLFGDAFALLEAEATAENRYDFLVCNNVLEHVIDPRGLLRMLKELFSPPELFVSQYLTIFHGYKIYW